MYTAGSKVKSKVQSWRLADGQAMLELPGYSQLPASYSSQDKTDGLWAGQSVYSTPPGPSAPRPSGQRGGAVIARCQDRVPACGAGLGGTGRAGPRRSGVVRACLPGTAQALA